MTKSFGKRKYSSFFVYPNDTQKRTSHYSWIFVFWKLFFMNKKHSKHLCLFSSPLFLVLSYMTVNLDLDSFLKIPDKSHCSIRRCQLTLLEMASWHLVQLSNHGEGQVFQKWLMILLPKWNLFMCQTVGRGIS